MEKEDGEQTDDNGEFLDHYLEFGVRILLNKTSFSRTGITSENSILRVDRTVLRRA
jgi:hypothetical protein